MNVLTILVILSLQYVSNPVISNPIYDPDNQGTNMDRLALLAIKSQISDDPHGVLSSWNDSLPICQWQGVTCGVRSHQRRPRVVGLYLVSKGLLGTLSPSVGNLSFLHHLYLANNSLGGHIPSQIGHLLRLRSLVLEDNSFKGEVPANISRCLNLEFLGFGGNHLSGTIPFELGHLSKLVHLTLYDNIFTGNLNSLILNMTSLGILSGDDNSFQGNIPDNIGQRLTNLRYLGVAYNKITGTIPHSFCNLSSLQVIDLNHNQLEGSLSQDNGFCFPQLSYFRISDNSFHGQVPVSLSNLTQLETLDISSNNFTGNLLFNARNMVDLRKLQISFNYLGTGEEDDLKFLQTLANCSKLKKLDCSANNFRGTMPDVLGNLTELSYLNFQSNQITGTIPSGLVNLINLELLLLRHNQLIGYLLPGMGHLAKLRGFVCDTNNLMGTIPYSLGNLSMLETLYLDNNKFEGEVPSSLGDCKNLLYLGLSQNNLTSELPPHLFHASMLVALELNQNHLQGNLPAEIGNLGNLVLLDMSENAFSGEVPSDLGSCTQLLGLDMGANFFTGSVPQSFQSLTSLQFLNLSRNRLFGRIPDFLANFSLIGLDLSCNNFNGEVSTRGVFTNISRVLIYGNSKLCGGIPELHLPRCLARRRRLSFPVILTIAISCLVVGVSVVLSIYLICCWRKRNKLSRGSSTSESFPKVSYDMLLKATDGFSQANLLGTGHYGSVYKGVLHPNNMVVAIKVFSLEKQGASKSFMAECKALRNMRHRNLLKIVTACSSTDFQGNDFKALVYEFMPNGNLEQWIHFDQTDGQGYHRQTLTLLQKLDIAIDVACALDYLQNSCGVPLIHCDVKPSNILLDHDMVGHVGDFGLARFLSYGNTRNSSSVALKGTVGYAAPEYGIGSAVSKEGDIYSYGITLIEMMTATKPTDRIFEGDLNLHLYAKSALPDQLAKVIDPRLLDDSPGTSHEYQADNLTRNGRKIECIKSIIEIGVKCSVESPYDRMSMEDAVTELKLARDNFVRARRPRHQHA